MREEEIYWLSPNIRESDFLDQHVSQRFHREKCTLEPSHFSREYPIRPLKIAGSAKALRDWEWTFDGVPIVGPNVVAELEASALTGFKFLPIRIFGQSDIELLHDKVELCVVGQGGMAARKSGVEVVEKCPRCGRSVYSGYTNPKEIFDPARWDGSDFFRIWPLPVYLFVTHYAREVFDRHQWTGVRLQNVKALPKCIAGTLTPGHQDDWIFPGGDDGGRQGAKY